jgi:MYXO-CTERM domain-containing protein
MNLGSLRQRLPFSIATAVIALHVVDDNYLQPASGQGASDHLVSGLVPLGIMAVGAWLYPKVRAGVRALIAIALGLFGLIVGGIEAGFYAVEVGPSGDDYTGLLAVPAGLLLIGLGAAGMWRSRRRTPNPWWRQLRRLLLGAVAAVADEEGRTRGDPRHQVERMNPTYHRLAGPTSSIWPIDDALHVRGPATHPEEYEDRVIGFFDSALAPVAR